LLNRKDEAGEAFDRAASLTDDPALREYLFQRSAEGAGQSATGRIRRGEPG
jgi:predicted RNA polymerase sigma factor